MLENQVSNFVCKTVNPIINKWEDILGEQLNITRDKNTKLEEDQRMLFIYRAVSKAMVESLNEIIKKIINTDEYLKWFL